jgi:hypothetical protein
MALKVLGQFFAEVGRQGVGNMGQHEALTLSQIRLALPRHKVPSTLDFCVECQVRP